MFYFVLLFCIISMLSLITGCNDTPNSVGKGSIRNEDYGVVHVDTSYATAHSTILNPYLYTASIDRFLLGKDGAPYEAWACLKFDVWPDSMVGVKITGATIRLKGLYHFGDSLAPLSFNAYRAMSNLFGDSLTYDSLMSNTVSSAKGIYYNSAPLSVISNIPAGDTSSITIKILDTAMVREWLSTNNDTTDLNHGLVFIPTNSNIIKGFYSFGNSDTSYQPTLYVDYVDSNAVSHTYIHKTGNTKYVAKQDLSILVPNPSNLDSMMYIQNGISFRGLMSFDSIQTTWPVLIHSAVLQVTLNSTASSARFLHDSLFALSVGSNGISDQLYYPLSTLSTDSYGRKVYSFDVMNISQRWFNNISVRKVGVSGYFEGGSFDLHAIYGAFSDKKVKPRLIITYSAQR
jgi:hypothetical protein